MDQTDLVISSLEKSASVNYADLQQLFNTMEEGVILLEIVTDENGRISDAVINDVNNSFYKILPLAKEQVIGQYFSEVFRVSSKKVLDFWNNHSLPTEIIKFDHFYGRAKQWFHITVSRPIENRSVVIFYDNSLNQSASSQLIESENKYRSLFEESFDGLFISTLEGKFLDINRKGLEILGYASKEEALIIDLTHDVYTNPNDRPWVLEMVRKYGVAEYDIKVKRKDQKIIVIHSALTAIRDKSDEILGFRGIFRDVTDKKKIEEELFQQNSTLTSILESSEDISIF
jgi:PAS domain S-box-containing protein